MKRVGTSHGMKVPSIPLPKLVTIQGSLKRLDPALVSTSNRVMLNRGKEHTHHLTRGSPTMKYIRSYYNGYPVARHTRLNLLGRNCGVTVDQLSKDPAQGFDP